MPTVLQVGVIGHRRLPDAEPCLLQTVADRLFRQIRLHVETLAGDAAPVELRCVSNLAEGADAILAETALAAGYALLCPLPLHREAYERDFAAGEGRDRFRALLAAASAVYEIDGVPGSSDSYLQAGRLLLEQSDIVIAVWDGRPERGVGGTGQTVREARRADVPLVVIDAAAPHAVRAIGGATPSDLSASLARWISCLIAPPTKTPGTGEALDPSIGKRPALAEAFNRALERALLFGSRASATDPDPPVVAAEIGPAAAAALAHIERHVGLPLAAADALAVRYAERYRFAATLRFLAIIPAAVATVIGLQASPLLASLGFATQLALLLGTLFVSWADARAGWHRRYVAYRTMAEHLRHGRVAALLGSPVAQCRPSGNGTSSSDCVAHRLRATARSLGMISARVDATYVADVASVLSWDARRQLAFYEAKGARFLALADRLRAIGSALWIAGITFTALRLGLAAGHATGQVYRAATDLALVLPGLAAVFFGLRSQNEFSRLSQLYGDAARRLARMIDCLPLHVASRAALEPIASETRVIMMAEVSDWHALIAAHDLHAY